MQKSKKNPMHRLPDWRMTLPLAQSSPRCGAKTRSECPCKAPAMANGRCRMHGGTSTGPRTTAGIERIAKARIRHGLHAAQMQNFRRCVKMLDGLRREGMH